MESILAFLGVIVAALGGFALKLRGDKAQLKKEAIQQKLDVAKAQNAAIFEANKAASDSEAKGKEEVRNAVKKAEANDFSGLDNDW